jgi:hypothetical protein
MKRIDVTAESIIILTHSLTNRIHSNDSYSTLRLLNSPHVHRVGRGRGAEFNVTTPLHILALKGYHQVLKNPYVDKIVDHRGRTPLCELIDNNQNDKNVIRMCKSFLRKKYPWYPLEDKISGETVLEILKCNNAQKFIMGL